MINLEGGKEPHRGQLDVVRDSSDLKNEACCVRLVDIAIVASHRGEEDVDHERPHLVGILPERDNQQEANATIGAKVLD